MIFVVGGSGGKLKNTDAVIVATVPAGSTVTATKGTVSLKPTLWTKAADSTLDCAIFSVPASQFDSTTPWTITATDGTHTASETVTVSVARQYDVILRYILYLFNNGDQCTDVTGGWKVMGSSATKILDDSIVLQGGSQAGNQSAVTNSKVNPGGRTVLKVKFVPTNAVGGGSAYRLHAGLSNQNTSAGTGGMVVDYVKDYSSSYNTEVIYTIDISNYKNSDYYIKSDINLEKATIYEVWMEW